MSEISMMPGWKIIETIGHGGFSTVYKICKTDDEDITSALKVISIPKSGEITDTYRDDGYGDNGIKKLYDEQCDMVLSEIKLMRKLEACPNIVRYYDHFVIPHEDGFGCDVLIRMELLTPLTEYVKHITVTEKIVNQLGTDILEALKCCERENITHRDIKPQNIYVNKYGRFILGDFGVSVFSDATTMFTKVGTADYMAPEIAAGQSYHRDTDLYSLGLVLYWFANDRRLPFVGENASGQERNEAQMKRFKGYDFPNAANIGMDLNNIIRKACNTDRHLRYQSAQEMQDAIKKAGENIIDNGTSHQAFSYEDAPTEYAHPLGTQSKRTESHTKNNRDTVKNSYASTEQYHCLKCGKLMEQKQQLCDECLREFTAPKKYYCPQCGVPVKQTKQLCDACLNKSQSTPKYFCPNCGTPVEKKQQLCAKCSADNVTTTMECPECLGTIKQTFFYAGKCFSTSCTVCNGTGKVTGTNRALKQWKDAYDALSMTQLFFCKVNKNCSVCHGHGMIKEFNVTSSFGKHSYSFSNTVCPKCSNKDIVFTSEPRAWIQYLKTKK